MEKHVKRASLLVAAGLFVQLLSLLPVHPLAFVAFLLIVGAIGYLIDRSA